MKSFLLGLILFIVALFLASWLIPAGVIFALIYFIIKGNWSDLNKYFSRVFKYGAKIIDIFGNYACAVLFNVCLLKKNESIYRFGKEHETISSALGKNLKLDNLNKLGLILNVILNTIDKDHSIKSIDK